MRVLSSRLIVILLALILITAVARALPGARTIDDAFITFRYSRNLAEGMGFVYNPGIPTLGTTTPLFALVTAGMAIIFGSEGLPYHAIFISTLADMVTVAMLYGIARRVMGDHFAAIIPALLWAISPMSVTFAVGGMETSVTILWMIAATWLYVLFPRSTRRDALIGICAGLGLLTRVDSVLWIAPLFAAQLFETWRGSGRLSKRLPLATWAAVILILLPWALAATAYFGSPIPNSVTAKRFAYLLAPLSALIRLIQTYSTPFFEFDTFGSIGAMVGAVVYLALSLIGIVATARRFPRLLPLLLYPWLYLVVFAALNPLIFRWYNAPPIPALILGIVLGAWALTGGFSRRIADLGQRTSKMSIGRTLFAVLGAVWLFTSVNGWTLHPDHGPDRPAPTMAWHALELLYERMGRTLRDDLGVLPETRVASGDIGAVGYFSRATIVDTVGLVTPELSRYYPVDPAIIAEGQNYAIPPDLIADTQPEYLVTMEGFIREGLARDPRFTTDYALTLEYPFEFYGSAMQLYERRTGSGTGD